MNPARHWKPLPPFPPSPCTRIRRKADVRVMIALGIVQHVRSNTGNNTGYSYWCSSKDSTVFYLQGALSNARWIDDLTPRASRSFSLVISGRVSHIHSTEYIHTNLTWPYIVFQVPMWKRYHFLSLCIRDRRRVPPKVVAVVPCLIMILHVLDVMSNH